MIMLHIILTKSATMDIFQKKNRFFLNHLLK